MATQPSSSHTPGPWTQYDYRVIAVDPNGHVRAVIAHTANSAKTRTIEAYANATLIAAAPELLELLKAIAADASVYQWHIAASKLIAKSEGR